MIKNLILNMRIYRLYSLARRAYSEYTYQLIALIGLGFFGGILEGVGINALIPMFSFITGDKGDDPISQYIEKFFSIIGINFSLQNMLMFIVTLFVLKALILFIIQYTKIHIGASYLKYAMHGVFSKSIQADWPYLLKQKVGHLENVIMVDAIAASGLLKHISMVIIIMTSLLMYIIVALNIDMVITLVTLLIGALLALIFKPLFYKTRKASEKYARTNKRVAHYVNTHVLGLKTIKSMHLSKIVIREATSIFETIRVLAIKKGLYKEITVSFIQPISMILIIVLFAISYKTSDFNIAAFAVIIYLINRIFTYTQQLFTNIHGMNTKVPHLQQVLTYQEQAEREFEKDKGIKEFHFNKEFEFSKVSFNYSEEAPVLHDISFTIRKGEMIGIIGKSGSGKTTIIDLILRLFHPTQGTIIMDGNNINDVKLSSWRDSIAYVSQDMFLLNDTIRNNVVFYDDTITEKEIIEAIKKANIHDLILEKPDGLDTMIGERGVLLSVGQRQRIVLARALVRKPSILLLDEATSALDNESEVKIQKALKNLKGETTIIMVAHRLSTIKTADRLLVLNAGVIAESGSPTDLLKNKKSYFYKVYMINSES